MQNKIVLGLGLMVSVAAALLLSGCSLAGYGVGAIRDSFRQDQKTIPISKVVTIEPGTEIIVSLRDGNHVFGQYAGLEPVSPDEYAKRYARCRDSMPEGGLLPQLGDRITIIVSPGQQTGGEFAGFDYRRIVVKNGPKTIPIFLHNLTALVDRDGDTTQGEMITKLISDGRVPFLTSVAVDSGFGRVSMAIDSVEDIYISVKKRGKRTGFIIGAVIDVALIAAIVIDIREHGIP